MEDNYKSLAEKAVEFGALEARLISTKQIIFDSRSYLKCRFGCNCWGMYRTCPPNLDIT